MPARQADLSVVPAQAGTQGFRSPTLAPRFRGGDGFDGTRLDYSLEAGMTGIAPAASRRF